ncbi:MULTISPECIES: YqaA family protein [Salegentibacter]|jgi:membrane protein YqaA with SNARE-associated domain|uniref:Membrane protein YqaA, SNARE-associated domain n=2 Tax=Salegentibacter TaxID=143222 RepID=A0A1I2KA91_9FLAO|nr:MULTISPECIES: VTT domain-containing protein [Salegentibacter]APS39566.1 short-chain dehydrogenase [Salegentibacter sp. T436]MBO2545052.1 VTT domain-containing protein [Salegentibacter sp. BDJ18]PRX50579.1 membrane protein YqaA with SNARE-associated domain [Salegentibacter salegens]SFF63198.1 membrane protein YqaA, SNARE-associated domain [Salegentibacter agarivorans]SHM75053.1 membrane protein YqaA, SNARE-associated domain [Salegentibacter salegens]|tara:strand:- start:12 stop:629 length:618 start_codon:yes stop_codon:yes gene_type:complete
MKKDAKSKKKSRIRLLHQYYSYTGFYSFVWKSVKKAILPIVLFVAALWAIDRWVLDIEQMLVTVTETYSPLGIISVFFASESLLGLIPPELFIAWSGKSSSPILYLSLLALASYLGGVISYFIGRWMTKIPAVHEAIEVKMAQHIKNTRKWGGFLIIVGALLPIPFAMTSIAAGIIKFPFPSYLMFGLLRFVRFYLYALVIFEMV